MDEGDNVKYQTNYLVGCMTDLAGLPFVSTKQSTKAQCLEPSSMVAHVMLMISRQWWSFNGNGKPTYR